MIVCEILANTVRSFLCRQFLIMDRLISQPTSIAAARI
jgi:hypothetical protein